MPKVKTNTKNSPIYCHKCGTKNDGSAKFCMKCGAELHLDVQKEKEVQHKEKVLEKKKVEKTPTGKLHWGIYALIVVIIVIIGSLAYVYLHFSTNVGSPNNKNSSYKNTSNQCTTSSQCSAGSYCSSFGACVKDYCGDGVCTPQKQQSNSCPIDCGCPSGEVLNKYTGTCQQPPSLNSTTIMDIVDNYLKQNNINGTITAIKNSYYGNQAVKEADVNCQTNQSKYPCGIIFYLNSNGTIINVTRTD